MLDEDVFSKITRISKEKTTFMLSEIIPEMKEHKKDPDIPGIIEKVINKLPGLGFSLNQTGEDYEISTSSKGQTKKPFILSADEQKRLLRFFEEPKVPKPLDELLREYITKKTGKRWDDPVTLERIRQAVITQKGDYWREGKKKKVHYEQGYRIFAYLAYQFPVYFIQFEHILEMLASSGLLKEEMTVLDIGSGPGVAALATIDFLSRSGHGNATLHAVELAGEQREAFTFLTRGFSDGLAGITVKDPVPEDLITVPIGSLPREVDLLVFQNVLNELTGLTIKQRAARVKELSEVLSPGGVIVITEPADMVNSITMRQTVQELARSGLVVIAPCPAGWTKICNSQHCWSFVEKPPLRPTRLMDLVASCKEAYRYLNTDIKYSYAVLKKEQHLKKPDYSDSARKKTALLSTLARHVDRRINVFAAVMSGDLGNSKTHLWKLCDGTPQKPVYAVMPSYHISSDNEYIMKAGYTGQVEISGVLVRYNPNHDSYNLLITRATRIMPAGNRPSSRG
ncbi:MAG: small ribosomal subunit Rsm22 family protein [Methanomicrobiales archaeon]